LATDKILITGGLGFIGINLAQQLLVEKRRVVLFDNLSAQIHGAVPDFSAAQLLRDPAVEVLRGDVCQAADWAKALDGVGCVAHLAAETGTAQSMYEISRYTGTNVGGTAALLDYLSNHRHQVSKIILASSRSVYGEGAYECSLCGLVYPPMRAETRLQTALWEPACPICAGEIRRTATPESARTAPASIYAATKLAQEDLVHIASQALGIAAVIFRFQNVYGEGQSLKNPYTGILSIFSTQIRAGKTVNLYEDGNESRDFVHVSDVARAVVLGINGSGADGATLNVGSGLPTSVQEIALLLQDRLGGTTVPRISGQYRLGDIRHGYADLAAAHACLGFTPEISLEEGLTRFVTWVKTQPLESDLLDRASAELVAHGLMPSHVPASGQTEKTDHTDRTHAKAASL
jgi:dTDP-L-rhamnose 4-epimerase